MKLSPHELKTLLALWVGDTETYQFNFHGDLGKEIVEKFLELGVMEVIGNSPDETYFRCTEKGKVWVGHILTTPLPVQLWKRGEPDEDVN